jgi:hypothetical protein
VIRFLLPIFALLIAAYFGARLVGSIRWSRKTNDLVRSVHAAQLPPRVARFDPAELDGLPTPVQRYFGLALTPGQPIISRVRVRHEGVFNIDLAVNRWVRFTSDQHVVTSRPGFVWDGRMGMAPGLNVRVIDAYVTGEGVLHPAVFGLFDITHMRGDGEIARGELMRFFAEAAWYPTALLPSQGVTWTPIDDVSADATLNDGDISLCMRFGFAQDSTIKGVRAEARSYINGARIEMHPWEGSWSSYHERDGMRVPLKGEVAWLMPEGRKPYWRGNVTDIAYTFAASAP